MNFGYRRSYRGPIEAVLLDWAGTTMDFGCMAPAVVFVEVFERKRMPITTEEARAPEPRARLEPRSDGFRAVPAQYAGGPGWEPYVEQDRAGAPREALVKRLLLFVFPQTELFAWGGEPILRDGSPVGELTSVGYSASFESMVALGYVHGGQPETAEQVLASRYEIEVSGVRIAARATLKAPWRARCCA